MGTWEPEPRGNSSASGKEACGSQAPARPSSATVDRRPSLCRPDGGRSERSRQMMMVPPVTRKFAVAAFLFSWHLLLWAVRYLMPLVRQVTPSRVAPSVTPTVLWGDTACLSQQIWECATAKPVSPAHPGDRALAAVRSV